MRRRESNLPIFIVKNNFHNNGQIKKTNKPLSCTSSITYLTKFQPNRWSLKKSTWKPQCRLFQNPGTNLNSFKPYSNWFIQTWKWKAKREFVQIIKNINLTAISICVKSSSICKSYYKKKGSIRHHKWRRSEYLNYCAILNDPIRSYAPKLTPQTWTQIDTVSHVFRSVRLGVNNHFHQLWMNYKWIEKVYDIFPGTFMCFLWPIKITICKYWQMRLRPLTSGNRSQLYVLNADWQRLKVPVKIYIFVSIFCQI